MFRTQSSVREIVYGGIRVTTITTRIVANRFE